MADYLNFLVPDEQDNDRHSMGVFGQGERETKLVRISVANLRENLRESVTALKSVLTAVPRSVIFS